MNKIIDEIKNLTFENKEKENLLISIFDKYYDNDDKKFVITGKILLGTVNIHSLLNYKTINSNKIILNKNIKPLKISKTNGIYIEKNITNNKFISINFDIKIFKNNQIIFQKKHSL